MLELTSTLQTTLEVDKLIELFAREVRRHIEVDASHLSLGFDSDGDGGDGLTVRGFKAPEENEWLLFLSDKVDLDLTFELGMADADLDLTGLRVERLSVESGMATTRLPT